MLKLKLDEVKLAIKNNLVLVKIKNDDIDRPLIKEDDAKLGEISVSFEGRGRMFYRCNFCNGNFCFSMFLSHFINMHGFDWKLLLNSDRNHPICQRIKKKDDHDNKSNDGNNDIKVDYFMLKIKLDDVEFFIKDNSIVVNVKKNNVLDYSKTREKDSMFGEIYLSLDGILYYNCTFCNENYYCFNLFLSHFIDSHDINWKKLLGSDLPHCRYNEEVMQIKSEGIDNEIIESAKKNRPQDLSYEEIPSDQIYVSTEQEVFTEDDVRQNYDHESAVFDNSLQPNAEIKEALKHIMEHPEKNTQKPVKKISKFKKKQYQPKKIGVKNKPLIEYDDYVEQLPPYVDFTKTPKPIHFLEFIRQYRTQSCKICRYRVYIMSLHFKKHEDMFICPIGQCSEPFETEDELKDHYAELHDKAGRFKCSFCYYTTPWKRYMFHHYFDEHLNGRGTNPKPKLENEKQYQFGTDPDPEKQHFLNFIEQAITKKCKLCKEQYSMLSIHYRRIHHHGTYSCTLKPCAEPFDTEEELNGHMAALHGDPDNPYKCGYCEYKGHTKVGLKHHYRRNHLIDKNYKCRYCVKNFFYMKECLQHERTHTGEKPFTCNICSKGFRIAVNLRAHKKRAHEDPTLKCEVCSKMFYTKEGLNSHKINHTAGLNCVCHICGASYRRPQSLRDHMLGHKNETFVCELCSKVFTRKKNLNKHMKIHLKYKSDSVPKPGGRSKKRNILELNLK